LTWEDLSKDARTVGDLIISKTEDDAKMLGLTFKQVGGFDHVAKQGNWVVALAVSSYYPDYHWWVRGDDGTWYHKVGNEPIKYWDYSDNTIYDPAKSDRGRYDAFVGYFEIGPK